MNCESIDSSNSLVPSGLALHTLRPYQQEIALAILDSVHQGKGLTFSVEIARQGGKNELSAMLELVLLTLSIEKSRNLVKCSPTFKPQAFISMQRLKDRLNEAGYGRSWVAELGYITGWEMPGRFFFRRKSPPMWWVTPPTCSLKLTSPRTSAKKNTPKSSSLWVLLPM